MPLEYIGRIEYNTGDSSVYAIFFSGIYIEMGSLGRAGRVGSGAAVQVNPVYL